jgi:hypothetical protein
VCPDGDDRRGNGVDAVSTTGRPPCVEGDWEERRKKGKRKDMTRGTHELVSEE